ncbi:MAG: hypothetical protein ACI9SG_002667, partial [Maribacter sp.]
YCSNHTIFKLLKSFAYLDSNGIIFKDIFLNNGIWSIKLGLSTN